MNRSFWKQQSSPEYLLKNTVAYGWCEIAQPLTLFLTLSQKSLAARTDNNAAEVRKLQIVQRIYAHKHKHTALDKGSVW